MVINMDTERIMILRNRNDTKRRKNEANYQAGGGIIYSSRARAFEELVEICDIALSVSKIRDDSTHLKVELMKHNAELKSAIDARDYPEMLRCCENINFCINKTYGR